MKFTSILTPLTLLPVFALADSVSFDPVYDNATESLNIVSCSDGPNGLESKGFTTFGSLPNFPFIGGAAAVEGFDSLNCGTCWNLTFVTSTGVSNTISVLAIDNAGTGFNIAMEAMDVLTDNQAVFLGRVNATSVQVDPSICVFLVDLYGNDEFGGDEGPSDQKDVKSSIEALPVETKAATPVPKDPSPAMKPSPAAMTEPNGAAYYSTTTSTSTQHQLATQQIPTYEQPQPSEPIPSSGAYQNIPVNERTIRPSEMKDEGKMFIGGLNWDTTDETLRDYFSQFGKVDACTIMRDAAGRSRCFAFLTFEDPASVNAVMVREHVLDGKIIDPKRAIPRQEHQRATKLFIGGLAGSVTSESMREFFSQFGKVIDSTVMLDRETGRSKGFGFVSFEDTNVQPFLGFGNLEIDGKLIDVKLAQPRYQRDSYPNEDGQGGGGNFQGGGGARFNAPQGNFAAGGAANTPFDPQALAQLYTRMFQMAGGGQMNPAMMGMNPMMAAAAGMGGAGFGGMRPGMGMGMGGGMGMAGGMGGGGMSGGGMGGSGMGGGGVGGGMGGVGRGNAMGGGGAGTMGPNVPRGPRGAGGGATPTGPMGAGGTGPQRSGQRGQHSFHPYAR
ncbi:hypothetical protein C0993_007286 [Termitomyces sp. T159_Od127]|nr:hypothetical protein C0993_007286 [Termitomyces sp. T159_Od127]